MHDGREIDSLLLMAIKIYNYDFILLKHKNGHYFFHVMGITRQ